MASYHITVTEVHPDGDAAKRGSKQLFAKECLTVGEANELLKAKKDEYSLIFAQMKEIAKAAATDGKIPQLVMPFSIVREHY